MDKKIKVYKVKKVLPCFSNGEDILYFINRQGRIIGKIDFTMKIISGVFKDFKIKRDK
jgi:hypothetical protein